MSIDLIESKRRSHKSFRRTFVSIAIHVGVISLAVYATASAGEAIVSSPVDTVHVLYTARTEESRAPRETARSTSRRARPDPFPPPREPVPFPTTIPDHLPPISSSMPVIDDAGLFGSATNGDSLAAGSGTPGDGEPFFVSQVEKPAVARDGNPNPKYPSILESARVEGVVLVQFVVDTLGRAGMSTFRLIDASNEVFAQALEAALPKWRFYTAETGGRKVKEIVQLPLKFVAPLH